jgi:hypothetical protein
LEYSKGSAEREVYSFEYIYIYMKEITNEKPNDIPDSLRKKEQANFKISRLEDGG